MMDYDTLAMRIMLSDAPRSVRHEELMELNRQADVACGIRCPDCDGQETESNGHREYRCTDCDTRWGGE